MINYSETCHGSVCAIIETTRNSIPALDPAVLTVHAK